MKKSILLIAGFCVVALGVLGYTFLYAGSANPAGKSGKECATACEKAHGGMFYDAATTAECPHATKAAARPADGCCATGGAAKTAAADAGAGKSSCMTSSTVKAGMSREECASFHATAKAEAETQKIEIK